MATSGPVVDHKYMKDIEGARKDLRALVHTNNAAPILLRLAFHDAANYNAFNNTGGVNGSVRLRQELNQPPNNGIKAGVDLCEGVKKKHPRITYADLFQLAGIVAVQESGGPTIDFVPGRADTNVPDQLNIPNPNGGAEHLRKIFYKMGLMDKDIVALSGAHTLGRARRQNSGFDGPFTRNPLKFDNSYFVELLKGDTPGLVKFPTDKALLQDPVFRPLVELYARDKGAFFSHYAESHKKLSELGFANNSPWCFEQDRCAEFTNNCEFTSNCELPNNYEFNSNCCEQQYKYCGAY